MKQLFLNLAQKPHKLFFFGGIVNAMIAMAMVLLQYQGILYAKVIFSVCHAYTLIFAVFTQFFSAFLLTMFPRFLATPEVPVKRYLPPFLLLNGSSLLFVASVYFTTPLTAIASAGQFVAYLMIGKALWDVQRQSRVTERYDTNWILATLASGAVFHLLFLITFIGADQLSVTRAAINGGFFLYLLMMIVTLSQKMIPFFSEKKVAGYQANRSRYFLESLAFLLVLKVFLPIAQPGSGQTFWIDGLLLVVVLRELIRWRLPLFRVDAILWVLYLSLAWMPVAFLLFFIEGVGQLVYGVDAIEFEKVALHTLAIGYFTTLLIGFGSRIILGHAGFKPIADRFTILLFWLVQLVAVVRITAGFALNSGAILYADLIAWAAGLWLLLFVLWSKRYAGYLFH